MDSGSLKMAIEEHLFYRQGKTPETASLNDMYLAVSYAVRNRLLERSLRKIDTVLKNKKIRLVSYLSAEFLMGTQLVANLDDLGITEEMKQAVKELGHDLEQITGQEQEPGLGNGGLGRLAACTIDSLATLQIPAWRWSPVSLFSGGRQLRATPWPN
jgi:starch phosphorylase